MSTKRDRPYKSPLRQRQADATRQRILQATGQLLAERGYEGTTIDAIAAAALVSAATVYAAFGAKAKILAELLNQATFGAPYAALVERALAETAPRPRLAYAAAIARQIFDAERPELDLWAGAGVVGPDLAAIIEARETRRYESQHSVIALLMQTDDLRSHLDESSARDILWTLTGRDHYRRLVVQRGWSSQRFEEWLADTLQRVLLKEDS